MAYGNDQEDEQENAKVVLQGYWDDGSHDDVKEIYLTYGDRINSMQTLYIDGGLPVLSPLHGVPKGNNARVELRIPNEYLIKVWGFRDDASHPTVVHLLEFVSNQRKFGPYGVPKGTPFERGREGHKIVGFKGRAHNWIEDLDVHTKPINVPTKE